MCDPSPKIEALFASDHTEEIMEIDEFKLKSLVSADNQQITDRSSHERNSYVAASQQNVDETSFSTSNTPSYSWLPDIENISSSSADLGANFPSKLENSNNAHEFKLSLSNETRSSDCARLILNKMENALRSGFSAAPVLSVMGSSSSSSMIVEGDRLESQMSLNDLLLTYNKNLGARPGPYVPSTESGKGYSFFNPSHSLTAVESLERSHMRPFDIIYNINTSCETLEGLFGRYVERFIGVETSSSYNLRSSSRAIKQLKITSPGRRLSHLAIRRKVFSSANLKSSSLIKPTSGRRHLLLIDKTKLYPKTSHVTKSVSTKKKTPKSAKRQQRCSPIHVSSKRALFTSPVSQSTKHQKLPRRTLFSPINDENKKRRLSTSPQQDSDREKLRRIGSPSKFQKSQSFSIASSTSNDNSFIKQLYTKTQSEIFMQSTDTSSKSATLGYKGVLDEVVKQKILWSVSTALSKYQISKKHEKFPLFASMLAKLVKKVYLEFHNPGKSQSSQLAQFATQMVQNVISGHSPDQIYNNTKDLLQKRNSLKQNKVNLADTRLSSHSCSSLEFSKQSENLIDETQSENSLPFNLNSIQSGNKSKKKFGSDSNLKMINPSSALNILKAKRQISF